MADRIELYSTIPITGTQINEVYRFIMGNTPFTTGIPAGILPYKANVDTIVKSCKKAISEIINKYTKYKELGYLKNDYQKMALSQFLDRASEGEFFMIAYRWFNILKENPGYYKLDLLPTKKNYQEILYKWLTYHKHRTGNSGYTPDKLLRQTYPQPVRVYQGKNSHIVKISIVRAESLFLNLLKNYVNDNDLVYPSNLEDSAAVTLLVNSPRWPTEESQTLEGVKKQIKYTAIEALIAYKKMKGDYDLDKASKPTAKLSERELRDRIQKLETMKDLQRQEYEENTRRSQEAIDLAKSFESQRDPLQLNQNA